MTRRLALNDRPAVPRVDGPGRAYLEAPELFIDRKARRFRLMRAALTCLFAGLFFVAAGVDLGTGASVAIASVVGFGLGGVLVYMTLTR